MNKARKFRFNKNNWGYIFIIPFFLTYAIFGLYPMILSIGYAFTDYQGFNEEITFIGFENFKFLLTQPRFGQAFLNTGILWSMNFLPQISFALLFAAIFASKRIKLKGKGGFKLIYYMPNIITATSVAIMFHSLFSYPDGPIFQLLASLNIVESNTNFYRDPWASRLIISFIQFWMWFGNSAIILTAGIMGINPSLYEAAEVDGANHRQQFWNITIPLLKPILLYSLVTSLLGGLQVFDIPFLFLSGGPGLEGGRYATETIAVYIYKLAFAPGGEQNYGLAAAASVYLFILAGILSLVVFMGFREKGGKSKHAK